MKKVFKRTSKTRHLYLVMLIICYLPIYAQQLSKVKQDNVTQFLYGIASVYGSDFEGEVTASGERYSSEGLSVAHRSLPFNTRIEIENLSNGKKVEAIINDRGPFVQNRILDVSKQTADILGFLTEGTSFVKVTILELGSSISIPIGLPTPPVGNDIPQGFTHANINSDLEQDLQNDNEGAEIDVVDEDIVDEEIGVDSADTDTEIIGFEDKADNVDEGFEIDNSYEDLLVSDNSSFDNINENKLASYDTSAVADDMLLEDNLFADFDNEFEYMDDSFDADPAVDQELVQGKPQARVQNITNSTKDFIDNVPAEPMGFNTNNQDFLIDDPLSNIVIGPDEEYFAAPLPSSDVLETAPYSITPEERQMLQQESTNTNPFSDLFNDKTESYSLPQELRNSGTSPAESINPSYNIDGMGGDLPKQPTIYDTPTDIPAENLSSYTNTVQNVESISPPVDMNYNTVRSNTIDNTVRSNTIDNTPPVDVNTYNEGYDKQPAYRDISVTNTTPYLPPSPISPAIEKQFTPQRIGDHYIVQLGAFSKQKNALDLYEKLRRSGFNAYITDVKIQGKNLMRVRVGYFSTMDQAIQISEQLQSSYNLENRIIQVEYSNPNN